LDAFRGRQVWIEHQDGTISRYAHLDTIEPDVVVGAAVQRGQSIGTIGNSGSPGSIVSEDEDAHLHFELWLDNQYLGQYLSPIDIREWLEMIFTP
jgi:murein DD-endopeptidase MepM/ murein hydrolase activator NlpD